MLKRLSVVGLSVFALAGLVAAPAAQADATVCFSVQVTVNGGEVVNQAGCHTVDTP